VGIQTALTRKLGLAFKPGEAPPQDAPRREAPRDALGRTISDKLGALRGQAPAAAASAAPGGPQSVPGLPLAESDDEYKARKARSASSLLGVDRPTLQASNTLLG
jgi:hypothetical protein